VEGAPPFLAQTGEMADRIRRHAWERTALGEPGAWPQALQILVGVMLAADQPMFMVWGADKVWLYNDAFIPILGRKHPAALGRHALDEVWREASDTLTPLFDAVFNGVAVQMDDLALELDRKGVAQEAHFTFSYTPARDASGAVVALFGVCTETTELYERRREQEASERALSAAADAARAAAERIELALRAGAIVGTWVWDVPDNHFVADEQFAQSFGLDPELCRIGLPLEQVMESIHPADRDRVAAEVAAALARGGPYRCEYRVLRGDGAYRWTEASGEVELDQHGGAVRFPGVLVDIEERRKAEEHRRLLVNELNHRVKNTLSVVQGLARQTFRNTGDVRVAVATFEDRLTALSRAHNLLTDENWASASLRDIIGDQLGVDRWGDRIALDGPEVALSPQVAVSLALALHELGTNAAKYGALSNDNGRVLVRWRTDPGRATVILRWAESGGPPVTSPARPGFGSRMIERALAAEAGGRVALQFQPDGVVCDIEAPMAP